MNDHFVLIVNFHHIVKIAFKCLINLYICIATYSLRVCTHWVLQDICETLGDTFCLIILTIMQWIHKKPMEFVTITLILNIVKIQCKGVDMINIHAILQHT
jgi:hypothetical protein